MNIEPMLPQGMYIFRFEDFRNLSPKDREEIDENWGLRGVQAECYLEVHWKQVGPDANFDLFKQEVEALLKKHFLQRKIETLEDDDES